MSKLLGRRAICIAALSVVSGLSGSARAGVAYWDANGATPGASLTGGTWSTVDANWTTDATGSSATTFWVDGDTAVFSAGTDHTTGAYGPDIIVSGTIVTPKIIVEECDGYEHITGGAIQIGGGSIDASAVANFGDAPWFFLDSQLTGTGGLTIKGFNDFTGFSFFALTNTGNSYTGDTTIESGLVMYGGDGSFGTSGNIILNGGGLAHSGYTDNNGSITRNIVIGAAGGYIRGIDGNVGVFTGSITGTGTLSIIGNSTTVFDNAGYAGPIVVGNGTQPAVLQLGNGGVTGSAGTATSLTFKSGAGFGVNRSDNINLSSVLPATRTFEGGNIIQVSNPAGAVATIDIPFGTSSVYQGKVIARSGTVAVGSGGSVFVDAVELYGNDPGNPGIVEVGSGGSLTTKYLNMGAGNNNFGVLNQTGGTVTVAAGGTGIRVGHWNNSGVAAELNITGGTFDATGVTTTAVGWDGAGVMTVGGGAGTATFTGNNIQIDANGDSVSYNDTLTIAANGIVSVSGNIIAPAVGGADTVILNGGKIIGTGGGTATISAPINVAADSNIEPALGKVFNITGLVSGGSALNIGGAGTVSLNNASNSISNVNVLAGATLRATATQTAAINAAGTLAGTGSFTGSIDVSGTVAPGVNGVGTLNLGTTGVTTTTISGKGIFDLNGASNVTGNDLAAVFGNLTFTGGANIRPEFYGPAPTIGAEYTVFTYDGTLTGTPVVDPTLAGTFRSAPTYHIDTATTGQVKVVVDTLGGAAASLVWTGNGVANEWDLVGATNWLNGGTPDKFYNADTVLFDDTGSTSPAVNLTVALSPGGTTVNNTNTYTFSGSGGIRGNGGLTKSGTGTLILSNTNTYTGPTAINGGVVQIANNNALGAGSSSVTLNGGTIKTTASFTLTNPLTMGASGGTLDVAAATTLTRAGSFTGGTLTKTGTGTVAFSGYSNGSFGNNSTLTISGGTARFNTGLFNTPIGLSEIVIDSAGTLLLPAGVAHALGGAFTTDPKITINGGTMTVNQEQYLSTITMTGGTIGGAHEIRTDFGFSLTTLGAATPATISARVNTVNQPFNINVADGAAANDLVVSGQITNNGGGVAKSGLGRVLLSNASNSYNGATNVNGGTLEVSGNYTPASMSVASGATVATGASLVVSGSANYFAVNSATSNVTVNGTLNIKSSAVTDVSNVQLLTGTGKVTLDKGTLNNAAGPRVGTLALTGAAVAVINTTDGDGAGPGVRGSIAGVSKVTSLSIDATSKLDLKNNGLIIPAAGSLNGSAITVDTLRAAIIAGRGGVGTGAATWSGAGGIGTSTFAFDETFDSIGYAWTGDPNILVAPIDINGESYSAGDYVVKYCAGADADLSGVTDDTDVAAIGLTYDNGATTGHHWYEGDFNYDGLINDDDVAIIGLAYNPSGTPLNPSFYAALSAEYGASFASAFASGASTVVPEPTSLGLLAVGAMGLLRRRRK